MTRHIDKMDRVFFNAILLWTFRVRHSAATDRVIIPNVFWRSVYSNAEYYTRNSAENHDVSVTIRYNL